MALIKKAKLTPSLVILEESAKLWWKNLKKIIIVYLWGIVFALGSIVAASLIAALLAGWQSGDLLGSFFSLIDLYRIFSINPAVAINLALAADVFRVGGVGIIVAGVTLVGFLLYVYFSIRAYLSIFLLIKHNYQGKELVIFQETRSVFWPYLGLVLLTALLVFLWSLLLIIPGIIFAVFYSLVAYVFVFEGLKGWAAIKRSRELIRSYWWPFLGRLLFVSLTIYLFVLVITSPLTFSENYYFIRFWTWIIQIAELLIGPIALLFIYRVYQDLVKIKASSVVVNENSSSK